MAPHQVLTPRGRTIPVSSALTLAHNALWPRMTHVLTGPLQASIGPGVHHPDLLPCFPSLTLTKGQPARHIIRVAPHAHHCTYNRGPEVARHTTTTKLHLALISQTADPSQKDSPSDVTPDARREPLVGQACQGPPSVISVASFLVLVS